MKQLFLVWRPLPAVLCALVLGSLLLGQKAEDPYTQGDEAAMKKAGYASFGPFTWGDGHDSLQIQKMLPAAKLVWIETRHFKLGCDLPPYKLPKSGKWRKKIQGELKQLKKFLPTVNPRTRSLDPWLRAHLFAWRLEQMYDEVCKIFDVTDADFPRDGKPSRKGQYMGKGPYLGMPKKFPVLLLTKAGDLIRYSQRAGGTIKANDPKPVIINFIKTGSLGFGTACELAKGGLFVDKALHAHLWFNITHNLVNGYKYYAHRVPTWCDEGLGHYFVLRLDPAEHVFSGIKGTRLEERKDPKWGLKIRRRVKNKDFTPMAELMRKMTPFECDFGDHMAMWSRMDFLIKKHPKALAAFLDRLKAPITAVPGKAPSNEAVLKRQDACFEATMGMSPAAFDKAWVTYVQKTYPRR